jgi:hypothetical protein
LRDKQFVRLRELILSHLLQAFSSLKSQRR